MLLLVGYWCYYYACLNVLLYNFGISLYLDLLNIVILEHQYIRENVDQEDIDDNFFRGVAYPTEDASELEYGMVW